MHWLANHPLRFRLGFRLCLGNLRWLWNGNRRRRGKRGKGRQAQLTIFQLGRFDCDLFLVLNQFDIGLRNTRPISFHQPSTDTRRSAGPLAALSRKRPRKRRRQSQESRRSTRQKRDVSGRFLSAHATQRHKGKFVPQSYWAVRYDRSNNAKLAKEKTRCCLTRLARSACNCAKSLQLWPPSTAGTAIPPHSQKPTSHHLWFAMTGAPQDLASVLRTAGCPRRESPRPFSQSRYRPVSSDIPANARRAGPRIATMSLNRSCTQGVSRVSASAALSLRTIGSGVPFGKNRPNQVLTSKSGRPCSAVLGRFGSSGERFGCRMAMPLTVLASISGLPVGAQRADVVIAAGDQVLHRRAAAAIRHMGHIADAERCVEQLAEQMAGRAGARRAELHRLLVGLHIGGEFLEGVGGKVLAREQDGRLACPSARPAPDRSRNCRAALCRASG